MASTNDYLHFIVDQLSGLQEISWRPMMGEFLIYYKGKLIGGIYNDRFLVKSVPASKVILSVQEIPYPGAKPLLLADIVDDPQLMIQLVEAMYPDLPEPKSNTR